MEPPWFGRNGGAEVAGKKAASSRVAGGGIACDERKAVEAVVGVVSRGRASARAGGEEARALAQRRTSAPLFFLKLRERAEVPPEGVEVRVGHRAVRAMLPLLRRRSGNIQGR